MKVGIHAFKHKYVLWCNWQEKTVDKHRQVLYILIHYYSFKHHDLYVFVCYTLIVRVFIPLHFLWLHLLAKQK